MRYLLLLSTIFMLMACNTNLPRVSSGEIIRFEAFESSYVNPRNVDVWLPSDYSESKKYAVLYMHDGQMLFDSTKTWNGQEWQVDETIPPLVEKGRMRDCIVVGIWNDGDYRWADYNPQKAIETLPKDIMDSAFQDKMFAEPNADNYLKFIVEELKPFIDQNFSTKPDLSNTFIMGSSMGGLISMYAICEYPEVFGGAGCLSTHWVGDPQNFNEAVPMAYIQYLSENIPDPADHKLYFDFGTETLDQYYEPYQRMADSVIREAGYDKKNWLSLKFPGDAHTEDAWAVRLYIPLKFLMRE
jgi:predicted alpha/beta superfamily hydrolase